MRLATGLLFGTLGTIRKNSLRASRRVFDSNQQDIHPLKFHNSIRLPIFFCAGPMANHIRYVQRSIKYLRASELFPQSHRPHSHFILSSLHSQPCSSLNPPLSLSWLSPRSLLLLPARPLVSKKTGASLSLSASLCSRAARLTLSAVAISALPA